MAYGAHASIAGIAKTIKEDKRGVSGSLHYVVISSSLVRGYYVCKWSERGLMMFKGLL